MSKIQTRRGFMCTTFAVSASLSTWRAQALANQAENAQARLAVKGALIKVETSGTGYEVGRQYGEGVQGLLKKWVDGRLREVTKNNRPETVQTVTQAMLDVLRHDFPFVFDEIRGMADAVGIPFQEMAIVQLSAGVPIWRDEGGCSNVVFRRSDHGPILGKTLDASAPGAETSTVRIVRPSSGHALVCESRISGLSTESGINDKGLAVGVSSVHFKTSNKKGVLRNFTPRLILQECSDVEEAIRFVERHPVIRSGFQFALVDRKGNSALIERSPTKQNVVRTEGVALFCTNHCATPAMRELELSRGAVGDRNSDERYANLQRITSAPDFKPTLENLKAIIRSHRVPGGICQHGELEMHTRRAYICRPAEGKFMVTAGPACSNEFQEFSL
ncbi:MAG: C45 family autoproteolytic acyltransferase/hydrolase [Acidobacteriota bacterium]